MGDSSSRRTPPHGMAVILEMVAGVKNDLTAVDNRLTSQIGAVNEKVDGLRDESATQSASLARIETSLSERREVRRFQTETTRYKRKRNIALITLAGIALTLVTAFITHSLGG